MINPVIEDLGVATQFGGTAFIRFDYYQADGTPITGSPLTSFETSMSGYGMQVKYLMAAFLAIYALTMLIQFTSSFMNNSSKILSEKIN